MFSRVVHKAQHKFEVIQRIYRTVNKQQRSFSAAYITSNSHTNLVNNETLHERQVQLLAAMKRLYIATVAPRLPLHTPTVPRLATHSSTALRAGRRDGPAGAQRLVCEQPRGGVLIGAQLHGDLVRVGVVD